MPGRSSRIPYLSRRCVFAISTFFVVILRVGGASGVTPNDPLLSEQAYLDVTGFTRAWSICTGSSVSPVIAILDTGVDLDHEDLSPKLIVLSGSDYLDDDDAPQDSRGHGTIVAGIAAAAGNNALGVAGVSWRAGIIPMRVIGESASPGPQGTKVKQAFTDAADWATANGVRLIINTSWVTTTDDRFIRQGVEYAHSKGVLIVSGARPGSVDYPAAYPETLAVGRVNLDGSPYGAFESYVEVVAPEPAYSTTVGGGYGPASGAGSYATPQVTGLASLIWTVYPDLTRDEVRQRIIETVEDPGAEGWDENYAYGRIKATAALGDFDDDGLVDSWEMEQLGSLGFSDTDDPDGDGMLNYQEYIAGTDPADPQSFFRVVSLSRTVEGIAVECLSDPSRSYQIFRGDDFLRWEPIGELTPASGSTIRFIDTDLTPRFNVYRVEVLQ